MTVPGGSSIQAYEGVASTGGTYAYEFDMSFPDASVTPLQVPFGTVATNSTSNAIVQLRNIGDAPLGVSGLTLAPASGLSMAAPTLPAQVAPGDYIDVPLTYAPTAVGELASSLTLETDDPDSPEIVVPITGTAVSAGATPQAQARELVAYFDASVAAGDLSGVSSGKSGRVQVAALRAMIKTSADLIGRGRYPAAKLVLRAARLLCDGKQRPQDTVAGPAQAELAARIQALIARL